MKLQYRGIHLDLKIMKNVQKTNLLIVMTRVNYTDIKILQKLDKDHMAECTKLTTQKEITN